jgi:hypothetical protein
VFLAVLCVIIFRHRRDEAWTMFYGFTHGSTNQSQGRNLHVQGFGSGPWPFACASKQRFRFCGSFPAPTLAAHIGCLPSRTILVFVHDLIAAFFENFRAGRWPRFRSTWV